LLIALLVAGLLQQTVYRRLRDKLIGMPPGPMPAPIIGTFYELSPPNQPPGLHRDFYRLFQKYGPIYTLYFGVIRGVVLNTPELWYEALHDKQEQTAQRPNLKSFESITHFQGVAMNNGKRWQYMRTIMQRHVTNKQVGTDSAPLIAEEVESTLADLRDLCEQGKDFDLRQLARRESINVLMRKVFSFRFANRMSPAYSDCQDWLGVIFEHLAQASPSDFMPILEYFPEAGHVDFLKTCTRMETFIDVELQKHKNEVGQRTNKEEDFIDAMLRVQKEAIANNEAIVMTDLDIKVCAWDLMAGAIDTSATTMEWIIYILVNHRAVLNKLHGIMDDVVGPNRLPTLDDVKQLEYLTAIIDEAVRWKHFAPQGLPHEAAVDMTLGGYNIPKGTQIFFNFFSLHHNPKLWKEPDTFRPERFLEEERPLLDSILHGEMFFGKPEAYKFVPYGQGKRRCAGYGIGRIVLWLKAALWLHCFDWETTDGKPLDLDTETMGITMVPKLQKVRAIPRPAAKLLRSERDIIQVESR